MTGGLPTTIDIELTNRCNADCRFCPRDMTPHQGMMAPATFDRALARAVEYAAVLGERFPGDRFDLTFCGMGEPLLHPRLPEYVGRVRAAGITPSLSSNGSLLDEARGRALLDAGLAAIYLNIGDRDEAYEEVYRLPFERTVGNVLRFKDLAQGRCEVIVVLVDHRDDAGHAEEMRSYWASLGIPHTYTYALTNRGGSLDVDRLRAHGHPEVPAAWDELAARAGSPICGVPFHRMFVGYDGAYYLCSADWEKRAATSDVFESSVVDVTAAKLTHVVSRQPVCSTCNLDPTNVLAAARRAAAEGGATAAEVEAVRRAQVMRIRIAQERVGALGFAVPAGHRPAPARTGIPVRSAAWPAES